MSQPNNTDHQVNELHTQTETETTETKSSPSRYAKKSVFFQGYQMKDGKIEKSFSKGYSTVEKNGHHGYMIYDDDDKKRLETKDEFDKWKTETFTPSIDDYFNRKPILTHEHDKLEKEEKNKKEKDEQINDNDFDTHLHIIPRHHPQHMFTPSQYTFHRHNPYYYHSRYYPLNIIPYDVFDMFPQQRRRLGHTFFDNDYDMF